MPMKRVFLLAYLLLLIEICAPSAEKKEPEPMAEPRETALVIAEHPKAPEKLSLLIDGETTEMDMQS